MNENSPLLGNVTVNADDIVPKFVRNPAQKKKQKFIWAIPSQETEESYKDRFFSIKISYFCMFMSAVSFTITISSMWPYLQIIDKTTNTSFFGWIVSGFSIGQLLSSPVFGFWSSKSNNHKIPIITCLLIGVAGNILYFYLESTNRLNFLSPKWWMLISRFIMGVGAACAAVIRSYVSSATNVEERTFVLANISASQGLGFIIGPVLQAAFVPLNYPGVVQNKWFHLNVYSSPAFFSIIIYVALVFLLIFKFNEYVVLDYETHIQSNIINADQEKYRTESLRNLPPPDYVAVAFALILFFINCFVFSFFETLSSPLTIDMYAWSKKQATLYNGIILGGFGIFAVVVVLVSKILSKIYKEKMLMLVGYIMLLVSVIALLPWGSDFPSVQIPSHKNSTRTTILQNTTTSSYTEEPPRGCPLNYDWCFNTPIIQFYQFLIGLVLLVSGYSMANVMSFAIYSKLLGPKPQGLMMGLLTSCGSLSRALGPIVVSYMYGAYGPRVSFATLGSIIFLAILIICFTYKRYEPYKFS